MLTAGIDLCDDYLTAYSGKEGILINVPTAVCREKHADTWHIGEDAYKMALSGEGVLTDKLLTLLKIDGTSTIMRKTYSAVELLSKILYEVLKGICCGEDISGLTELVIAIKKPDMQLIKKIMAACVSIGIDSRKITIVSHEEAFVYYVLSSDRGLYANRVALFDLSNEKLSYYEFMVVRGISRHSAVAEGMDTEESFRTDVLKNASGAELADHILKVAAEKNMSGKLISSVLLTGRGFERTDWAKEFLSYVCVRRKVLYEKGLFAIGADKLAEKRANGIDDEYLVFCDTRTKFEISMPVVINDRKQSLTLISPGQKWMGTSVHAEVIPSGQDYVEFEAVPVDKNKKAKAFLIKLQDFPKRPDRCTRLSVDLFCESENEGSIVIKDMGFGEFFRPSGMIIEEKFRLN